jgi:inner membrane protein
MASIFGHIAAAAAIGQAGFPREARPATFFIAGCLAAAPDLDVLAFRFGVSYGSQWGHRGWTHSLLFTIVLGLVTALIFNALQPKNASRQPLLIALWFVLSAVSHPLLDMLTNGGRGCALWWPLSLDRIFFPWHPIIVSPLGAGAFFSEWGLRVLASELVWIGLPGLLMVLLSRVFRV